MDKKVAATTPRSRVLSIGVWLVRLGAIGALVSVVAQVTINSLDYHETKCSLGIASQGSYASIVSDIECERIREGKNYLFFLNRELEICRISANSKIECLELPETTCPGSKLSADPMHGIRYLNREDMIVAWQGSGQSFIEVAGDKLREHCMTSKVLGPWDDLYKEQIVSESNDLTIYDLRSGLFRQHVLTNYADSDQGMIDDTFQDSEGNIWVSYYNSGNFTLFRLTETEPEQHSLLPLLENLCRESPDFCDSGTPPLGWGRFSQNNFYLTLHNSKRSVIKCSLPSISCSLKTDTDKPDSPKPEENEDTDNLEFKPDARVFSIAVHPISGEYYAVTEDQPTVASGTTDENSRVLLEWLAFLLGSSGLLPLSFLCFGAGGLVVALGRIRSKSNSPGK